MRVKVTAQGFHADLKTQVEAEIEDGVPCEDLVVMQFNQIRDMMADDLGKDDALKSASIY